MRLIDADALLELLGYQGRFGEDDEIYNLLTNAPTVQREGWVSVPIEPTEEMIRAGGVTLLKGVTDRPNFSWPDESKLAYKAMIQAAPTDKE